MSEAPQYRPTPKRLIVGPIKATMSKGKRGRPTVMTEEVLRKLEEAFLDAFTDEMACLYAGISKTALYEYCEEHKDFAERKEVLKQTPSLTAQKTLVGDLKQIGGARWWAEHRMPEFMPKSKVEHGGKIETQDTTTSEAVRKVTDEYEDKLRKTIADGRTAPTKP